MLYIFLLFLVCTWNNKRVKNGKFVHSAFLWQKPVEQSTMALGHFENPFFVHFLQIVAQNDDRNGFLLAIDLFEVFLILFDPLLNVF